MNSGPETPKLQSANKVLFMPWADLGQPLTLGPVTFTPWPEVNVHDSAVRQWLDRYFSRHLDPWGKPVRTVTLVSPGPPDFRPLWSEFTEDARRAVDALVFSIVCPSVRAAVTSDNRSLAPPTADRYQLLMERFSPGDDSIPVCVGGMRSVGSLDRITMPRPWDVGGSACLPDDELVGGFGKMFDSGFPADVRERVFRSLEWFRFAHTVGDGASDYSKVVMMPTAFEILLEFPDDGKKRHFVQCAESKLKRDDTFAGIRHDRNGRPHTISLPACWAIDFYELRSRIVHGDPVKGEDLCFDRWISHLIVADLVFWQFLVEDMFARKLVGASIREIASNHHQVCRNEPFDEIACRYKDDLLGFKETHQVLGWRPN
jgi:hypothetical protein